MYSYNLLTISYTSSSQYILKYFTGHILYYHQMYNISRDGHGLSYPYSNNFCKK